MLQLGPHISQPVKRLMVLKDKKFVVYIKRQKREINLVKFHSVTIISFSVTKAFPTFSKDVNSPTERRDVRQRNCSTPVAAITSITEGGAREIELTTYRIRVYRPLGDYLRFY
ncbi:hypothetical protein EVAR_31604_1 [Eumeta japonica]|uniref:Uncharacterized protein n=1 Tax=Eumeta variegata TaxID=151549 RepID=A0A4C1VZY0_EUMVA|nr:hypothetical protein EVAR_31604_1 [Eumeta japonica]